MDAAFLPLLVDTVQHAAFQSLDVHGAPTYASPVTRQARVEWTTVRFVNAQGQDRMSRAVVYFDWTFDLELADRLTFEDGTSPALQRIEKWRDEQGNQDHMRVFV